MKTFFNGSTIKIRQAFYVGVIVSSMCAGFAAHAQISTPVQFFSVIPDMPIMAGLTELPDQGVAFDKPEGRIIESVAAIEAVVPEEVRKYYTSVLPEMGWTPAGEGVYTRQGERLQLSFETNEGRKFLRVMLAPAAGFSG